MLHVSFGVGLNIELLLLRLRCFQSGRALAWKAVGREYRENCRSWRALCGAT